MDVRHVTQYPPSSPGNFTTIFENFLQFAAESSATFEIRRPRAQRFTELLVYFVLKAFDPTHAFTPPIKMNSASSDFRSSTLAVSLLVGVSVMENTNANAPHSMGTTIIGVTYNGGVVLGADSRTSTGFTQLADNVYLCCSGSVQDSQFVFNYMHNSLNQYKIRSGQPATVEAAAQLVRLLTFTKKSMLEMGLFIGGWDKYEGGKIYTVPLHGTIMETPFAIGGSGSSHLYGFFKQVWKQGMTKDEAEQLVVKAVSLANARDGASGGVVRTFVIYSDGVSEGLGPCVP